MVRSTRVPIAERRSPMTRSPSQCPASARSSASGGLWWPLVDHHLGRDVGPGLLAGPGPRDPQRPSAAQTGGRLAFERAAAFDVEPLVDGLMADSHALVVGEAGLQAV